MRGIPVTTVPRTLLDLAAVLPAHQLERAINEAEIQGLTDPLSLPDLIARYPRRKGVGAIRAILDDRPSPHPRGARGALSSVPTCPPASRPLDSTPMCWATSATACGPTGASSSSSTAAPAHDTRLAFEQDRERDRVLSAAGWRVIRITWRQLHQTPERVAADLRRLLVG